MPMPLPDYVQSPIREVILSKYSTGMKGLAKDVGKSYMAIVHVFKDNRNISLRCFLDMASQLGIEPDVLVELLDQPEEFRKEALCRMLDLPNDINLKDLVKECSEKEGYLYGLINGISASSIKEIYKPMARALNMSLEELGQALL